MKKITLLLTALFTTAVGFSQNVVVEQPLDPDANRLISGFSTVTNQGVFCGDDFVLTEETIIGEIVINGRSTNPNIETEAPTLSLYIYGDASGVPDSNPTVTGGGVVEFVEIDVANITATYDGLERVYTVNMTAANGGSQVVLPAGTYWLVANAVHNTDLWTGQDERWSWQGGSGGTGEEPVLIDPDDLFGVGATDWTNISGLIGASFTAFSFRISDEPELGVDENALTQISLFPNPSSDVVNVKVPSSIEITSSALYDVLGKRTGIQVNNGVLDISSLARGVYLLNLETSAGTLTEKIIKR